jgi:hypothetical protein
MRLAPFCWEPGVDGQASMLPDALGEPLSAAAFTSASRPKNVGSMCGPRDRFSRGCGRPLLRYVNVVGWEDGHRQRS